MATYSLGEFLEDDSVVLEDIPSRKYPAGHAYRFASPDFETGLWLKNLIELGQRAALGLPPTDGSVEKLQLDDDEEVDLYRRVMSDTLDQLRKDGVSWGHVQEIFRLLLKHWGQGQKIDVTLAEAAGEAAARPNRSTRRAKPTSSAPKGGSSSSRASGATSGRKPSPASTRSSGTSGRTGATKTA